MTDDYYSGIADGYDELHGEEQDAKLQEFLDRIEISGGAKVLDVGCGTGRSFERIGVRDWQGIDPSQGLIDRSPVKERILLGRAEELPFPENTFDVVVCLTALQNFDRPRKGLEEIRRVCKENGVVLLSFLKRSPKRERLQQLVREVFGQTVGWEQQHDLMHIAAP